MNQLQLPEFKSYEAEAAYWDNLDTGDFMEDDGEWFHFETPVKRAVRVAILPEVISAVAQQAHDQGVSIETLVNAWLLERLQQSASTGI